MNKLLKLHQFIKKYTYVSTKHLTPELKLYLLDFNKKYELKEIESFRRNHPYFGLYFPGEQALTRYIFDNPNVVKNKSVLEIGCGCGAASIAAVKCGAREVIANDIDSVAIEMAKLNASINNVQLNFEQSNLIGKNITQDVVLFSEVYPEDNVFEWWIELQRNNKLILLGDRDILLWLAMFACTNKEYFRKIITYELPYIFQEECIFLSTLLINEYHGAVYTLQSTSV